MTRALFALLVLFLAGAGWAEELLIHTSSQVHMNMDPNTRLPFDPSLLGWHGEIGWPQKPLRYEEFERLLDEIEDKLPKPFTAPVIQMIQPSTFTRVQPEPVTTEWRDKLTEMRILQKLITEMPADFKCRYWLVKRRQELSDQIINAIERDERSNKYRP